jgi:hypothetical protein
MTELTLAKAQAADRLAKRCLSECSAGQISMATLGRREKCPRNRSEKGHLRALRAHRMRNRHLPAPLETPWTNTA